MQTHWQSTLEVATDFGFSLLINIGGQLVFYHAVATTGRVTLLAVLILASAFVRRFIRYGRANRLLSARYQVDLSPRRFAPQRRAALNQVLADLQYAALWWGYVTTRPGRSWSVPPPEIPWCIERE